MAGLPSLSRQAPSVKAGHDDTVDGAGDPYWVHPKSDLELVAAPWGEADDVPPGDKRRLSSLSSPNTTTYLVGAHREDTAEP
jgi:hypothetical protein